MRIDEAHSIIETVGIEASLVRCQLNKLATTFPADSDRPLEEGFTAAGEVDPLIIKIRKEIIEAWKLASQ